MRNSIYTSCILLFITSLDFTQTVRLKFIKTTNMNGTIFPYDLINNSELNGSLAQVHTYVQQERGNPAQEVILLDAGDFLQGQPAVYYYNFERTDVPHLYARVMNYMKYDAAAVGNHDIETGHPVYDKFIEELDFPWLAANATIPGSDSTYFPPYTIIEKQGVRIAILGMVTPGIPLWLPEQIWQGMEFEDMILTAKKWLPILRDKEQPDLIVGLFHAGVDFTYGSVTADTPRNENAARLVAEQIPGFDIIFVGHDHHGWNMTVRNSIGDKVNLLGANSHARDVAVASVIMTYDSVKNLWQKEITGSRADMRQLVPDKDFLQEFKIEFDAVKAFVDRPIGEFTANITTRDAMFGNSAFVDLIHRVQLDLTDADVSFAAPLSFNATLDSGQVYVRDMFKLYKFENLLYTMRLTGREVKDFLEFSFGNWFNQMHSDHDHLLNFVTDENGNLAKSKYNNSYQLKGVYYNFDVAAGLNYSVDVSKPEGGRIFISSMADGSSFALAREYKVAINSYRGNGGGGHLTSGAGISKDSLASRIVFSTDKDLRYFLMTWIEEQRIVTPRKLSNWQVIPEDWWEKGTARDYDLLYGAPDQKLIIKK